MKVPVIGRNSLWKEKASESGDKILSHPQEGVFLFPFYVARMEMPHFSDSLYIMYTTSLKRNTTQFRAQTPLFKPGGTGNTVILIMSFFLCICFLIDCQNVTEKRKRQMVPRSFIWCLLNTPSRLHGAQALKPQ